MESHIYNKYIYGDREYAKLLEVLRAHLCNEFEMEFGGIIFCRYNPEKPYPDSNKVKVFPINPNVINKHFPDNEEIRNKYLEAINRERNIDELYYIQSLRTKSISVEHLEFQAEETLNFTTEMINRLSWSSYIDSLTSDTINILDQLFFSSKEFRFKAIPIPILSTPVIILVVPQNIQIDVDKIYKTVSESVQLYLFNKLINEINTDVTNEISRIKDEASFIKKFVDVFSEVTIPIKYTIDQEDFFCFDWYGNFDSEKALKFDLKLKSKSVTFFNPTFCWFDGLMVENRDYYRVKENQFKETIESIYKLIHKNWEAVREVEIRALAAYRETIKNSAIKPALINDAIKQLQMIEGQIQKALAIEFEQFTEIMNSVSKNVVTCKYIYRDDVVRAYTISYNDDVIYENKFKHGYHFGYDCLQEIIEKECILSWDDFTIIGSIKDELNKRSKTKTINSNQEVELKPTTDKQKLLSDWCWDIIDAYGKDDFEDSISYISNINDETKCANLIANFKKPVDDCYYKCKNHLLNQSLIQQLYKIKKLIDTTYSTLCVIFPNFNIIYENIEPYQMTHYKDKYRELFGVVADTDSKVKQTISRNVADVIRGLSKSRFGDLFKNHFIDAGLFWEDKDGNWKIKEQFHYNKSKITSDHILEWKFE